MTEKNAQKLCDRYRRNSHKTGLTYEVEREHPASTRYVVRSFRNGNPTGSTYHV